MNNFEMIIGVEVHTELNTKRKIFSPALNDINASPNSNVHPIDLGLPGTLPRFNPEVLEKALLVTKALNMNVTHNMHWDRKNYFYHDNPKGYQITQFQTPIGTKGYIELDNNKKIEIDFMHMEEDTAKTISEGDDILLDYNRSGVPLLEIVTTPCLRDEYETREYLEKLREILVYLNVSDGKMEEGSFRVDVNLSIRPFGDENLYKKVEIKNLNSFNNVVKAIQVEFATQIKAYNDGEDFLMSTKRFDESSKKLIVMRTKEEEDDYRYFPEPDLPLIKLDDQYIEDVCKNMPLLPKEIKHILIEKNDVDEKDVAVLMQDSDMINFVMESLNENSLDASQTVNYLIVNVNEYLNKNKVNFNETFLTIDNLKEIDELLRSQKISTNHVKKIIPNLLEKKQSVKDLIQELGIEQITDPDKIREFVMSALDENPDSIELYKSGKEKAFGFLIGKIMAKSKGQANPQLVNNILKEELDKV